MTRIALASAAVRDRDPDFNLAAMANAARTAKETGASLCCFGECVLQGFNCLTWKYEEDRDTGVSVDSEIFRRIRALSREIGIDLLFGFIEREGDALYSSCALIENGTLSRLYHRVSRGWKEYSRTDGHYREGDSVVPFDYRRMHCLIALCGDLWDDTASRFRMDGIDLLLWPVYVSFSPEEWENGMEKEYAEKAAEFAPRVLLINSLAMLDGQQDAYGGCAFFENGGISSRLPMGVDGILTVDL